MLAFKSGNILTDDADALVNTVNCVGVMGRGIALQFKNAFPDNFKAYAAACQRQEVRPGRMFVFATGQITRPLYIINFPTKRHWRGRSRIEDIESGLVSLVDVIRELGIRSVAIPPLGSGLGGLPWSEVKSRIMAAIAPLTTVRVTVYEPDGAPVTTDLPHSRAVPRMTAGRAALVGLMSRYLGGLLDPSVTLLEVHKLMYFMQEAGEPLKLTFRKAPLGPYAENLRHVLNAVEGHLVAGYRDGGDEPSKELTLVPQAVEDAMDFLEGHEATRHRFDRVAELVSGFESPAGLELLATVHWVLQHDEVRSPESVIDCVHGWSGHKRMFSARQIHLAADVLAQEGWVAPLAESATE